ncbi:zinc finger and SCAN domain-containing protein 20-like [Melanotaenia boesemani]|uniref:zinc finger and SCAN domain-containing protein 20-like n=1 Tax=Melanotaenia boesemani TaxID=1250792 RepID=UPI001C0529EE|nr:zinc finger and SCAN domain-containing protein 20-like [Melanotaenia boesemani]
MSASNSKVWSALELQTFLAIVGDSVIQKKLDGAVRNEKVYKEISQRMAAEGFERTSEQCRVKLKKLKGQYEKLKDDNSRSGNSRSTWRWYNAMDDIYGHRPANKGREGGLDSATALLESIINPHDLVEGLDTDASSFLDEGPSTSSSSPSTPVIASPPTQPEMTPTALPRQHTGKS